MACTDQTKPRKGAILIVVLAIIFLASAIMTAFVNEAKNEIKYAGLFFDQDNLRAEAYSYLDVALSVLAEIHELEGGLYGPNQGWNDPLAYAELDAEDVRIRITDETGKFSLARLIEEPELLTLLFDQLDVPDRDADTMVDSLIDWTDEDDLNSLNGAEADYYEDFDPPYQPPNARIESWDEFRLIQGFDETFFDPETGEPTALFSTFRSIVSLHHDQDINENAASPLIRQILYEVDGYDRRNIEDYLAGADLEPGTEDDRVFVDNSDPLLPEGANIETTWFRIEVQVMRGAANFSLFSIVQFTGSDATAGNDTNRTAQEDRQTAQNLRASQGRTETDVNAENQTEVRDSGQGELSYPFTVIQLYENFKI